MADGISTLPPAPRPSVEVTPSAPTVQVVPDAAGALAKSNRDSLEADRDDRSTSARLQSAQRPTSDLVAAGHEPSNVSSAAAALRGEAASLGASGGGTSLFDPKTLGNGAALLVEVAALQAAQDPYRLGAAATLAALSLQVPEAVPQLFATIPAGEGQSVRLHADGGEVGPAGGGGLRAVDAVIEQSRVDAAGFAGNGPSWPFFAALGLQDHMVRLLATAPETDPWAAALAAATGRPAVALSQNASPQQLFAALSQANPPLGLPVLVRGQGGTAYVVVGTQRGADGSPLVELLDVVALLGGAEARGTMPLSELLTRLSTVLLPNGAAPLSARHRAMLSALGLTGCCMTTGAGARGGAEGRRPSAVRPQGGLLEDRCLTCAAAQAACQP